MKNGIEACDILESSITGGAVADQPVATSSSSKCVVLENINHLFFILPLQDWFPLLKQFLSSCPHKVIILYKNDLKEDKPFGISHLAILKDLTELHIDLANGGKDETVGSCSLFLKKLSGRVERGHFDYTLDTKGKVSVQEISKDGRKPILQAKKDQSAVAAATNLTFNLSLSESQKSQKEALVLPYTMEAQAVKDTVIHYVADKNDDFDSEDDPDDDLEF